METVTSLSAIEFSILRNLVDANDSSADAACASLRDRGFIDTDRPAPDRGWASGRQAHSPRRVELRVPMRMRL